MNYFEKDCIDAFHKMIETLLKSNCNTYYKNISSKIVDILLSDDETDKQLFFDFFKTVECNDKEKIVNTCTFDVLNKVELIIKNANESKINYIVKYIKDLINEQKLISYKTNEEKVEKIAEHLESFMLSIHAFLYDYENILSDELKSKINNLNEYEKLTLDTIVLNIMGINFNEIIKISEASFVNIEDFVKLLDFYIPIYRITEYLETKEITGNQEYVKISTINNKLELLLNKQNELSLKIHSIKEIVYYLIYQFLINTSLDESSKNYINKVILILNGKLKLDDDTLNYLFKYYKNYHDIYSIEEQINNIENLKKSNLHPLLNLYASFDIADYKKLEKRKVDFGLKKQKL